MQIDFSDWKELTASGVLLLGVTVLIGCSAAYFRQWIAHHFAEWDARIAQTNEMTKLISALAESIEAMRDERERLHERVAQLEAAVAKNG